LKGRAKKGKCRFLDSDAASANSGHYGGVLARNDNAKAEARNPQFGKTVLKTATKRSLKKAYPREQKERGEWVELLFMAEAARLGLKVARPMGEARYDVLVEGGGKLQRVQVKSTLFNRNGCYECLCFWSRMGAGRQAKAYTEAQIDVVAAYVVPEDTWFVIPVSEIRTKTLYLPPRARASKSKYGKYLEAWHLLGAREEGLTLFASEEQGLLVELLKKMIQALVID
jgi:PD-(D/E)XK endonuclease